MKYSGIVCSKIWIHTKQSVQDVQQFIRNDVLRSISGRLRIYMDAFAITEPEPETKVLLVEPPRRVFFELKSGPILFSDYVFRCEDDDTVMQTAKAILDVDLEADNIFGNIETSGCF